jgi:hypothetical protein
MKCNTRKTLIKFVHTLNDIMYAYDGYFYSDGAATNESLNTVLPRLKRTAVRLQNFNKLTDS